MTYEQLLSYLSECKRVGDTHFSYPGNEECIFGATNQIFYNMDGKPLTSGETVYWAGYGCDIPNGTEYPSAKEFFEAPIYGVKASRIAGMKSHGMISTALWIPRNSTECTKSATKKGRKGRKIQNKKEEKRTYMVISYDKL